jgi:NADH dehydrogenase/NADH:ubiquinone oxidoreductase subunit G
LPTVTIDGVPVKVRKDATILDAARKAEVWIPTLCHNDAVPGAATCRLCMVELDRGDWKQLVTACNYPVRRDISVEVNSERAIRARKGVMELLLARAPESEELKALARRMGVEGTPYPTVTESQRNCILCGLCTRVCEEVMGRSAIGFAGRGVERAVTPPFRQAPESCSACGACVAVCPVGTIQLRFHEAEGEVEISPFKARARLLVCEECGARMVTEPVARELLEKAKIDWEEFRKRARICPECRRKMAAAALGLVSAKRGG